MKNLVNGYKELSVTLDGMNIVFFLDSGFSLNSASGVVSAPHSHYHNEMFFVLEGEMNLTVGDVTQRIEKGGCALVPKNLIHIPLYSDDVLRFALAFDIVSVKKVDSLIYRRLKNMIDNSSLTVVRNPFIEETLRRMIRYFYIRILVEPITFAKL